MQPPCYSCTRYRPTFMRYEFTKKKGYVIISVCVCYISRRPRRGRRGAACVCISICVCTDRARGPSVPQVGLRLYRPDLPAITGVSPLLRLAAAAMSSFQLGFGSITPPLSKCSDLDLGVCCGAPTGVGDRVRARAPDARLDYRMGRRRWAQAPPTPAGAGAACLCGAS